MSDPSSPTGKVVTGSGRNASQWRRKTRHNPLQADHAVRQGSISQYAFVALGRERAMAFLNAHNEALDGQPLAIATASEVGGSLVVGEIDRLAALTSTAPTIAADEQSS